MLYEMLLPRLPEEVHVIVFDSCVNCKRVVDPDFLDFEVKHLQDNKCVITTVHIQTHKVFGQMT